MNPYGKIHLWVGTSFAPEAAFEAYFTLDYSTQGDLDDPKYTVCPFCQDIGGRWYDEDFIGVSPRFESEVELDELLQDAAIHTSELARVKAICNSHGISKGNAFFWYADAELVIPLPHKADYNGLKYIGVFDGE